MNGVLVVDKPYGPTSFDVVHRLRSLLRLKKAGHTGTLDPAATGVLPICLGEATKIAGFITEGDKAYDAVFALGVETDTLDAVGKVTSEAPVPLLTQTLLEGALEQFRGPILQVPPMYSAIKIKGKRLYELARQGEEVERPAREVTVHALRLLDFSATELTVSVRCSKGFFVRSLAQDVGRALGCGGHLKALRRTQSGPFTLTQSLGLDLLATWVEEGPAGLAALQQRLVPLAQALVELPALEVHGEDIARVAHGVPLEVSPSLEGQRLRLLGPEGRLLAVAESVRGRLRYLRVMNDTGGEG